MAVDTSFVQVPAQSKNLDTARVSTDEGVVHRQVVTLASPETSSNYATVSGGSLYVNVQNASIAVTVAALPLPTGASTAANQTTANNLLSSINGKLGGVISAGMNTTTPLNASSTFTSASELVSGYATIAVSVLTDRAGTLYIDTSPDGTNWDATSSYSVAANTNEAHRVTITRAYARVRFTNTSASNQTFIRLQTLLGIQSAAVSPLNTILQADEDAITARTLDFNLMVTEGLYANRSLIIKDGINTDIDTGSTPEDVVNQGGAYTGFPAAAAAAEIVVAGADTGTVYYFYLATNTDTAYTMGAKSITGAGTYTLGHNIWRCNYAYFVGSAGTALNAGDITIRHTATPANVFVLVEAGFGQSYCSAYTVPYGCAIYIDRIAGNMRGSTSGSLEGFMWVREYNQSPRLRFPFELQFGQLYFDDSDYTILIGGRTDIVPRITASSTSNLSVKFSYRFVQVGA